jgi:SpoIID/LytB domain protein
MKNILIFIFCLTIFNYEFVFPQLFSSEPIIKVRIIYSLDSLNIVFNNNWSINDQPSDIRFDVSKNDSLLLSIKDNKISAKSIRTNAEFLFTNLQLVSDLQSGTLKIRNVPYGIGWWWQGIEDRTYEGEISININQSNKFDVIVILPLEKYLCGVLPYEIGSDAPIEALKSQVIAARSETISALISGKYKGDNYDLCADVECQVFAGNNKRTDITDKAVYDTRALCLFYDDKVIGAYYASNCGGISENVENVWPERSGPVPYWSSNFDSEIALNFDPVNNTKEWIESTPDVFCNPAFHPELPSWSKNNFRWQVELSNRELTQNLNKIKPIGTLKDIKVLERGKSGRIIKAKFFGNDDSLMLTSELEIRKIKDPPFRSSCFVFEKYFNSDGDEFYQFNGAGWGHGVGMCQSGAVARAFAGQNYSEILIHYFPLTEIKSIYK